MIVVASAGSPRSRCSATTTPIGKMRGQWFDVRDVPTMVTYHPAALLRNPAFKRPTWEDMQQVRDRLRALAALRLAGRSAA